MILGWAARDLSAAPRSLFAEVDVPDELYEQVLRLHCEAWPDHGSHRHDPALRPLSMLLLREGRVVSALDILSKDVHHRGDVYAASGLSAVVTDCAQRGRGFGHHLVQAAYEEIGRRGADLGLFTCDPPLQPFYEEAGWRTLSGTVLVGGTPDHPFRSDHEGKITMGHFYSTRARSHAAAFMGAPIALYPGEIDKLW
jgi:aminoglycoside 2'-N-acetyltransferase I